MTAISLYPMSIIFILGRYFFNVILFIPVSIIIWLYINNYSSCLYLGVKFHWPRFCGLVRLYGCVRRLESLLCSFLTPSSYSCPTWESMAVMSSTTLFMTARTLRGSIVFNQSRVSTLFRSIWNIANTCKSRAVIKKKKNLLMLLFYVNFYSAV